MIGPLHPEGQSIDISIIAANGIPVYTSPMISHERTYKNLYREIYLQSSHFYGTHYTIQVKWGKTFKLLSGNKYIITANYNNIYKGKKGTAITGRWYSIEASITVVGSVKSFMVRHEVLIDQR